MLHYDADGPGGTDVNERVDVAEVTSVKFDGGPDPDMLALSEGQVSGGMRDKMREHADLFVTFARFETPIMCVVVNHGLDQ